MIYIIYNIISMIYRKPVGRSTPWFGWFQVHTLWYNIHTTTSAKLCLDLFVAKKDSILWNKTHHAVVWYVVMSSLGGMEATYPYRGGGVVNESATQLENKPIYVSHLLRWSLGWDNSRRPLLLLLSSQTHNDRKHIITWVVKIYGFKAWSGYCAVSACASTYYR